MNTLNRRQSARKSVRQLGFTLVEMIIVLAIIGILIAVVTPLAISYITSSRLNTQNSSARLIFHAAQTACQEFEFLDRNSESSEFYGYNSDATTGVKTAIDRGSFVVVADRDFYRGGDNATNTAVYQSASIVIGSTNGGSALAALPNRSQQASLDLIRGNYTGSAEAAKLTSNPDKPTQSFLGRISRMVSDIQEYCYAIYVEDYIVKGVACATSMDSPYVGHYPSRAEDKTTTTINSIKKTVDDAGTDVSNAIDELKEILN